MTIPTIQHDTIKYWAEPVRFLIPWERWWSRGRRTSQSQQRALAFRFLRSKAFQGRWVIRPGSLEVEATAEGVGLRMDVYRRVVDPVHREQLARLVTPGPVVELIELRPLTVWRDEQ